MKIYSVSLVVIYLLATLAVSDSSRIAGGIDAERNEFVYLVSLQQTHGDKKHFCGGTILSQDWILSAASCLVNRKPGQIRVVAGILNQDEEHLDKQVLQVSQLIAHPNYQPIPSTPINDIGLLALKGALRWSNAVRPIALPKIDDESEGFAWIAGWGYRDTFLPVVTGKLQKARIGIISQKECSDYLDDRHNFEYRLNENMFCGKGVRLENETICNGDVGGPIAKEGVVIGVNSWTVYPCGSLGAPSIFTKVSKYISFIKERVTGV